MTKKPKKEKTVLTVAVAQPKAQSFLAAMKRTFANLKIDSPEAYERAGESMLKIDGFLKGPEVTALKVHAKDAKKVHAQAVELRDTFVDALDDMKKSFGDARIEYQTKIEEAEKKRAIAMGPKLHQQQIEDAKEHASAILRSGGTKREAAAIVKEAEAAPIPQIAPKIVLEKTEGIVEKVSYTFTITDPALIPIRFRSIDESLIRAEVNSFGLETDIPGVEVKEEKKQFTRGAA